jgi:lipopolysaccharide/colanic/teichoic acid biosynthesis glycosyltransferase
MTGLWQVSGRTRLTMPEMLALDLAYVESQSLLLDLRILLRTPYIALFGADTR